MAAPMDPSADPSADSEAPAGESISVVITAVGDGSYTVALQESAPEPGEAPEEPQTCASVDEALDAARQMLDQEGQEEPAEGEDPNAPMPPDQAKSVWDQMAAKGDKARATA